MSPTLILFTLCLPAFTAIIVWGANHHFLGPQQVNQRGGSAQLWLTSKRRYSFCSWESRLRMTPAAARVRSPTWTLVWRAGSDHKSWNWMWLRPSKENSGAACQSKKNRRLVQLIQPSHGKYVRISQPGTCRSAKGTSCKGEVIFQRQQSDGLKHRTAHKSHLDCTLCEA